MRKQMSLLYLFVASCGTPLAEGTAPLPGDEKAFDVIASFSKIAAHAGPDAKLVSMEARYVSSSGLMDLTQEYKPKVELRFAAKATQADVDAEGPQPPGSGLSVGAFIDVEVEIRAPETVFGTINGSQYSEKHLGMDRESGGLANPSDKYAGFPKCAFAQLWKDAISKGAPADVVAIIRYDHKGYEFRSNGRDFKIDFDLDCKPK